MIKCLVWDLDNTLWNGVLQDDNNIKINIDKLNIVKKLDKMGILQSIASKNDINTVTKKLKELNIKKYFLYPQCNYNSKVVSIKKIAESFNISLDAIAFIDDEPFEIYEINRYLPEVLTFLSSDNEDILSYFEPGNTYESLNRRKMMIMRHNRIKLQEKFKGTKEDFLLECKMKLTVREANFKDINRISELTLRTNKINSIHDRLDKPCVKDILKKADRKIFVCELNDIFGYHGVIGVCIINEDTANKNDILIDLFCISCRIEGRGIGHGFLNKIILLYRNKNIICKYRPLENNRAALLLLLLTGFKITKKDNQVNWLMFSKETDIKPVSWLL